MCAIVAAELMPSKLPVTVSVSPRRVACTSPSPVMVRTVMAVTGMGDRRARNSLPLSWAWPGAATLARAIRRTGRKRWTGLWKRERNVAVMDNLSDAVLGILFLLLAGRGRPGASFEWGN